MIEAFWGGPFNWMRLVIVGADIAHNFAVCTLGVTSQKIANSLGLVRAQIIADDLDGSF